MPGRHMKVRAVAAPSQDSTAVGSIELECTPHGLVMVYLGVAAYQQGYAPGAVTSGTRVVAPWQEVVDVRTHQDAILVSLNPALTPHHKLYLKNFSEGDADEQEQKVRRRLLRGATGLLMLAVGFSLSASIPAWSPRAGQVTALGLGITAAIAVLFAGAVAERLWLAPPPDPDTLLRRFLAEVQYYRPKPVLPAGASSRRPMQPMDLLQLLPRSTVAIVIVLSAGCLSAVLTSSWILAPTRPVTASLHAPVTPDPRVREAPKEESAASAPSAQNASAASQPTVTPPTPDSEEQLGESCHCERPDSVLWRLPIPRLSTLMIEQRTRSHNDHNHIELQLAVVNNGKEALKEISLQVQFSENGAATKDRPLYYESWLNPGEAIKWHVEARGTSFVVNNPRKDILQPDQLAGGDEFAKLLDANHRPVRLHGAMMLAYLDDPRATPGAAKLREALREEEAPYLDRVLATQGSAIVCDIRNRTAASGYEVQACVFNRAADLQQDLALKVRGLDRDFDFRNPVAAPPLVASEKVFSLPGEWAPGTGHWVSVVLPRDRSSDVVAKTFEAMVGARDTLF